MSFVRPRNSKRLQWHGAGGRYARPTMESAYGLHVFICPSCGGMHSANTLKEDEHGFTYRAKPEPPVVCNHCGKPVAAKEWK